MNLFGVTFDGNTLYFKSFNGNLNTFVWEYLRVYCKKNKCEGHYPKHAFSVYGQRPITITNIRKEDKTMLFFKFDPQSWDEVWEFEKKECG